MTSTATMVTMATQRPKVTVILTDEIRTKLENLAAKEMRSLSQMALVLLVEGLENRTKSKPHE